MNRAGIIEVSFDLLEQWLHLPPGAGVAGVQPALSDLGQRAFHVLLRSSNDFLPEVPEGGMVPRGTLIVTEHPITAEFKL